MSKKTTISTKDGRITGKQVTDGGRTTNHKVTSRNVFGVNYKPTSTTHVDSNGNRRTKTY